MFQIFSITCFSGMMQRSMRLNFQSMRSLGSLHFYSRDSTFRWFTICLCSLLRADFINCFSFALEVVALWAVFQLCTKYGLLARFCVAFFLNKCVCNMGLVYICCSLWAGHLSSHCSFDCTNMTLLSHSPNSSSFWANLSFVGGELIRHSTSAYGKQVLSLI